MAITDKDRLLALAINPTTNPARLKRALGILEGVEELNRSSQTWSSEKDLISSLKIARSTLWKWRRAGLSSKKVMGRRFYKLEDVDRFIDKGGIK